MKPTSKSRLMLSRRTLARSLVIAVLTSVTVSMLQCPTTADEGYEPELNIFAVLRSDRWEQEIILDRTYRVEEPDAGPVDDAMVIVSGNGTIDTCLFDTLTQTYRPRWPLFIHADSTYRVSVIKDGVDTLRGETTVPGDFSIISPAQSDTVDVDDTIVIRTARGQALCNVRTHLWASDNYLWFRCGRPDSLAAIPLNHLVDTTQSGDCHIIVTAFDPNFYKYHYELTDSVMRAGVTGGVGLFGSAYVKRIQVYLRPGTDAKRSAAILK